MERYNQCSYSQARDVCAEQAGRIYGRNTETLNLAVPEAEVVHFINHGAPNA